MLVSADQWQNKYRRGLSPVWTYSYPCWSTVPWMVCTLPQLYLVLWPPGPIACEAGSGRSQSVHEANRKSLVLSTVEHFIVRPLASYCTESAAPASIDVQKCTVSAVGKSPQKCEVCFWTGVSSLVLNIMRPFLVAENVAFFGSRFSYNSQQIMLYVYETEWACFTRSGEICNELRATCNRPMYKRSSYVSRSVGYPV
jgi:hypothetical protein